MKRSLINYLGLTGILSFLSYTAAVVFSPLAYPGYVWTAQAVSDLSAESAPSLSLWNKLSSLYNVCEVLCAVCVAIGFQNRKTKTLRTGIYLFAAMEFISAVGYRAFPLTESGFSGSVQDVLHIVVTVAVVLLSLISLITIMIAGIKDKSCRSLAICAAVALAMMLIGALGTKILPTKYFGIVERFSVFAATGFNAALGLHLFFLNKDAQKQLKTT